MRVNHRKIYEHCYGPIPVDDGGRTYEIDHIDGNHANNHPSNLQALSIKDHYQKHYDLGEWWPALRIAQKMKKTPKEISILASRAAKKSVEEGTHNMLSEDFRIKTHRSYQERLQNGTHHFLGNKNPSHERVKAGTHNLQGDNNPSRRLARLGLHHTQTTHVCPYCGLEGKGPMMIYRWHFDNCKHK